MRTPQRLAHYWVLGLVGALGVFGCISDTDVVAVDQRTAVFDLAGFVDYQDSVLAGRSVRKRVRVGEVDETKVIEAVDWAAELAPFAGANLNKTGLVDEYRHDYLVGPDGDTHVLLYTPHDSSEQRVRELRIVCGGRGAAEVLDCPFAEVRHVRIRTGFESLVADTEQSLVWTPEGYTVRSRQDVVGSGERVLILEGQLGE